MKAFFPEPIQNLPKANIPIEGLTAYLSQSTTHQTLYMSFEKDCILREHSHSEQVGFVLEGKIEITIEGKKKIFTKGEHYFIPKNALHSAKIYAPYADITFFNESDRYKRLD